MVEGATLSALCRRANGTWNQTTIEMDGIENNDGRLQLSGGASSYQRSCRDIGANGDMLGATCQRRDRSWNETTIEVPGIANINGVLRYQ